MYQTDAGHYKIYSLQIYNLLLLSLNFLYLFLIIVNTSPLQKQERKC